MPTVQHTRPQNTGGGVEPVSTAYHNLIHLLENAHQRLLDVIRDDLDRNGYPNLTPLQALLLFNIGDETLSIGDLMRRGYYTGTNATHNIKKLVKLGLLEHQRSTVDRRAAQIKLTDAGFKIQHLIKSLFKRHANAIGPAGGVTVDEMVVLNKTIEHLERFWVDWVLYRR